MRTIRMRFRRGMVPGLPACLALAALATAPAAAAPPAATAAATATETTVASTEPAAADAPAAATVEAVEPAGAVTAWNVTNGLDVPGLRVLDDLTVKERNTLALGDPVPARLDVGGMEGVQAFFVVPATVDETWDMLLDYENFAAFMEGIEEITQVTWTDERTALVGFVVPSPLKDVTYVLKRTHEHPRWVKWSHHAGDLDAVEGAYEFFPYEDGQTLVRYHTYVDIGTWVPAFIKRHFSEKGLEGLVADIQAEADRRYGATAEAKAAPAQ